MSEEISEDELWGSDYQFEKTLEWMQGARNEHEAMKKDLAIFKRLAVKWAEGDGWYAVDHDKPSGWHGPYQELSEAEHHAYEQLKKHGRKITEQMGRVK